MSPIALPDWQRRAEYIDFRGARIACWTAGTGKPLLLIHGFPTAAWDWSWIWERLAARHRLIACDMLGFGFSDKPKTSYSLVHQADLQVALLAHFGIQHCDALVHDYGVSVGQELLARQNHAVLPVAIERMCFLNGGMFPGQHRPRLIQKLGASPLGPLVSALMTQRTFSRSFAAVFGPATQPGADELHAFWQLLAFNQGHRLTHKLLAYMGERVRHQQRWVGALQTTSIPLKHINGGADPVSGEHVYRHWCQQLPNHEAVLLEGIGHYPQCEAPTRVADEVLAFLAAT
ncbi:MAG: alpha/beta fold hydrolase [Pseudomarimonas sp.]